MTQAISRRSFTRLAGASIAAASLPAPAVLGQARPRLAVVGGGAGGLSVARDVAAAGGIDVTVIERHSTYAACFWSNHVLGGLTRMESIRFGYEQVRAAGISVVQGSAVAIDRNRNRVRLSNGDEIGYDRLLLSPGIDFVWDAIDGYSPDAAEAMPHAYASDPGQLQLLWDQLQAMPDDGRFVLSVPPPPFRCPPGPYERAGLVARWLQRHKPKAKLLVLDASNHFPQQEIVQRAWNDVAPGMVEWLPADFIGQVTGVDPRAREVITEFERFSGDVVNLIPPQRAGQLAHTAELVDGEGWCPVTFPEMRSRRDERIFVVGDAVEAHTMPKSATAANTQAASCAGAIRQDLLDAQPPTPDLSVTCYAFLDDTHAISQGGTYQPTADGGVTRQDPFLAEAGESDAVRRERAEAATSWYQGLTTHLFGN